MAILLIETQIQLQNLQTQETKVWSKLAYLGIIHMINIIQILKYIPSAYDQIFWDWNPHLIKWAWMYKM